MCQSTDIKLCSCGDISELDFRKIQGLTWKLTSQGDINEWNWNATRGRFIVPEPDKVFIKDKISAEKILEILRSSNLFDFEYLPADGDQLTIWNHEGQFVQKIIGTFTYSQKYGWHFNDEENNDYVRLLIKRGQVQ